MVYLFIALCVMCFTLLIYPYIIYPTLLRFFPSKKIDRCLSGNHSMTLMFCAYNEGSVIDEKIENIRELKLRYPDLEVLSFDDGSDDDTFEKLSSRPDLLKVIRGGGRNGKAHGMKRLAAMASGEILIFTDANVLLDGDAVHNLRAWYGNIEVGGVCGTLRYLGSDASPTAAVGGLYWRLEEKIKAEESRTGNVMGADGSIFSLRRELYPDYPDTVLDDLTVSMAAVFAGRRLIKVEDVIAYERLVVARAEEFRRKTRIAARAYHTHLHLRPQLLRMTALDRFKYASRKVLRWFGGLFLIAGAVFSVALGAAISPFLGAASMLIVLAAVGIGRSVNRGPVAAVVDIVLALVATLIGVLRAMRGHVVVTWSPAKTR